MPRRNAIHAGTVPAAARPSSTDRQRLLLGLLLAPALLWLLGLVVLPHLDLALLSLRARVAPGEYAPSLQQYATFVEEPLYWHTFVRTAVMSMLATLLTLVLAFPIAWTIAKIARARNNLRYSLWQLRQTLGQPDGDPPFLLTDDLTVAFNAAAPHWLDVSLLQNQGEGTTAELLAAASPLTPTQLTTPLDGDWTGKDLLAHITAWEKRVLELLQRARNHPGGFQVEGIEDWDVDRVNEGYYEANKARPRADIQHDFHHIHDQLMAGTGPLARQSRSSPMVSLDRWPTPLAIPGDTYEHYEERVDVMREG